jgi:hypothetical protein
MGDRKIERFYSDRSGEIERALRELHIVSDTSQPGVPQNNAVAERLVQDILEGTRTALLHAGLPPCFWEYACQHYCLMENVLPGREPAAADVARTSPWEKMHGEPFYGKLIPIGAKVFIKPSETKGDSTSKMEPTSIVGVFAGYELSSGCRWSGIYMVWSLDEFVGIVLSSKK